MPTSGDIAASLKELEMGNDDIPTSILLGAGYDGEKRLAFLEFYEPSSQRIFHYYDKSGHMPYCFTKEPLEELAFLKQRKDVVDVHTEEKMDLINDKRILVSKIVTSDPLAIGGATNERSIRNTITAYEADIKYYENYLYDNQLQVGSFYSVREGKVIPEVMETAAGVEDALHKSLEGSTPPLSDYIRNWALLLTQPQPEIKRAAIDIEVYSPVESRIPDPEKAEYQIISVALAGSDGKKVVYVLERPGLELGPDRVPPDVEKRFFKTEPELLLSMYEDLLTYPVVITFNGDEFDLPYLYQRSLNMNIPKESIPITRGNQMASIRHGIHIDLYRAFNNRSIQIYAFSNKYSEHTLNGVASGLLGREKVEIDVPIGELLLNELAYYNYVDSELTLDLTRFDNDVFMKLFITICRISKMPLEDASRLNVSNWIRSLMIFEHRRWNALVPRREDLEGKGGASSEAIIRGKKYKGGFVVDPKPGVHFNVVVLDFASLYPSLIKVYNLSYETVRCVHPECRNNLIPETDHWVCTKRKGMTSLLIGSLRDVRVGYFKSLSKRPGLTKADKEFFNVISQALKVFLNACFTGDTDIVTPDGIKNIREMKVGDRVVNVNPETMEIDIDRVIEVQEFPYRGEMYHFNDRRFVDLMVTPNHRFLTTNGKGKKPVFRAAEEIFKATDIAIPKIKPRIGTEPPARLSLLQTAKNIGAMAAFYPGAERPHFWFAKLPEDLKLKLRKNKVPDEKGSKLVGGARPFFRVPARELTENDIDRAEAIGGSVFFSQPKCFKVPARLETEDFAALCGWFVSEGSLFSNTPKLYADGGHRGSSQGITVSQSYGRGNPNGDSYRNEIGRLLDRLGLKYDADPGGKRYFRIASSVLHEWMLSNCYMAGTLHHTSISKRVPRFVFESERNMKAFLDAAYMGDGSAKQCCYTTNSRRLAEDMVVLTSLLGAKSKIKRDGNVYRVVFKNVSSKLTYAGAETRKYVRKVPFDGTVYCVTTEKNHTVIAGRNGRFVHVGQSYGVMGYDNFALYCLPVAEATAALGRYSIGKTIDKAKELGVEVLYGDSVAGDSVVWVKEPAGVHATRIENLFGWPLGTTIDGKEYFMPRELSVLTLDDAGRAVFKPVKHVMRHLTKKRLYRLSLTNRLALTVTEDHSLISLPPRRGKESHAKSLKFVEIKPTEVGRRVKELIALTRVPLEKVAVRGYPREVYEFLGSFVGSGRFQWTEGRVGSKLDGYVIPAGSDAKALLSLVAKLKEGGWVEDYALQGSPGEIAIRGGKLTILLMELAEAFGQTKVPFFIFNESEENVASFLRGIFGLEGSLLLVKGGRVARLSSPRACIPDGIRELLWRLGMPSSTYYTVTVKKDGTSGSPLFWLEMEDAQALFEKVGFLDSKAKRRLQKASLRGARAEREGDFVRVGVMDVTEVKGDSYVYDLEVEGSHRFFANGILCHNTDSVFLRAPSPEQLDLILAWARKELGIDLEVDKVYRYAAFSSRKKNYAAVYPDGSLEVKGLTGKKSLAGDTPLLAKIDGRVELSTVVEVYRSYEEGRGVELTTVTDDLRTVWARVSGASAHQVDDVFVVKTSKGRVLKLSGDHSVYLMGTFGDLHCKETRRIAKGDVIVGARLIPPSPAVFDLDVARYLQVPVMREGDLLYSGRKNATTEIPVPATLSVTPELMFLLGLFAAEGSSRSKDRLADQLSQSERYNPEVCAEVRRAWKKVFGFDLKWYDVGKGVVSFRLPKLHGALFKSLCGGSSAEKHVPDFVYNLEPRLIAAYLKGLFSGDGYADSHRINITSKSRILMEHTAYLLSYFDVDTRIRVTHTRGYSEPYTILSIVGTSSRSRFQEEIGFLQPRMNAKMGKGPRNKELLPITTLGLLAAKKHMVDRIGVSRFKDINAHDFRYYNVRLLPSYNSVIDRLLEFAEPEEESMLTSIRTMLNSEDVTYDEVVSVERVPGSCRMFDFAVPVYERFVAGNLPTLVHNSNVPLFIKRTFKDVLKVLSDVKSPDEFTAARENIRQMLRDTYLRLKRREIPMEDLAFHVMMSKAVDRYTENTPQHVKAAQLLLGRGREMKPGDVISFVKTTNGVGVKPVELAKPEDIDVDKYVEYMRGTFDQLLDSLGYDFDEILGATKLEDFFGF